MNETCPDCGASAIETTDECFQCDSVTSDGKVIHTGRKCVENQLAQAKGELAAKDAEIERLQKIAYECEWSVFEVDGDGCSYSTCPLCANRGESGHAVDCLFYVEAAKAEE